MNVDNITNYLLTMFTGVETTQAYGYLFFFYGDDHMLPFATLALEDNEHDKFSNLSRPSTFRLNIGVNKNTYSDLFGQDDSRAPSLEKKKWDFTILNELMPHPTYAPQYWVCVLNPTEETFENEVVPLLAEAYHRAVRRQENKSGSKSTTTEQPK